MSVSNNASSNVSLGVRKRVDSNADDSISPGLHKRSRLSSIVRGLRYGRSISIGEGVRFELGTTFLRADITLEG